MKCIGVTHTSTASTRVRNTCDRAVKITKMHYQNTVGKTDRLKCGERYASLTLPPRPYEHTIDMSLGFCALEATFDGSLRAPPAPSTPAPTRPPPPPPPTTTGVASCVSIRRVERCGVQNRCADDLQLTFTDPSSRSTVFRSPLKSGEDMNVDRTYCAHTMTTNVRRSGQWRPVNAAACCTKKIARLCKASNACGKTMYLHLTTGRFVSSYRLLDGQDGTIDADWCGRLGELSTSDTEQ